MSGSHPRHLSFCGRNVPDWSGSAQGRGRTIHHISLSIALFLARSSCAASALALAPSVCPSRCLLLAVCLRTNAAQLRVSWMLGIPFSPLRLPSATLFVSAFYFSWFSPSCLSICHVFLALLFFSSYWLLSALLLLYYISASPSPSVLSTLQQSPRVKTCWHPLVWQVCVCVSWRMLPHYKVDICSMCVQFLCQFYIKCHITYKRCKNKQNSCGPWTWKEDCNTQNVCVSLCYIYHYTLLFSLWCFNNPIPIASHARWCIPRCGRVQF